MKYLKLVLDGISILNLSLLSILALTCYPMNLYAIGSMFLAYILVLVFAYIHKERKQRYFPSLLRCEMLLIMLYVTWTQVSQNYQPLTMLLLSLMFGSTLLMDQVSN